MATTSYNARLNPSERAKSSASLAASSSPRERLLQRGAAFVLRRRRIILPVMVLMLAAAEGMKLLVFGPHPRPAVFVLNLLILALVSLVVVLLIAALEHSEAMRVRAEEQSAAAATDRKQVAQNLHDTLAQNISYLRIKLDQFSTSDAAQPRLISGKDLEQMQSAAEEAYRQMRVTLDELNPKPLQDITSMVTKQAAIAAKRGGFDVRTTQIGTPYPLPNPTCQQILYIIREALHNVEKHAHAGSVHVQLVWLEDELILKVTDDGTGIQPDDAHDENHYGLWIMRHRAAEIGGEVTIQPADEQGTEVTLWLPRPKSPLAVGAKPIARSTGCEF